MGKFCILWGILPLTVARRHGQCIRICSLVRIGVLDGEPVQSLGNLASNSGMGPWAIEEDMYGSSSGCQVFKQCA